MTMEDIQQRAKEASADEINRPKMLFVSQLDCD